MNNSVSVAPKSRNEIRYKAFLIRKSVGLENDMWFPIIQFVEFVLPQIDPQFQFEILTISEMGDKHGNTIPDEHKIQIREDIYEGAAKGNGRDRGTIAHEVGHYLLHSKGINLARSDMEIAVYCDPEWQAKVFAGELLVPAHLVKEMSANEIASSCGVSLASANYQLSKIKNR